MSGRELALEHPIVCWAPRYNRTNNMDLGKFIQALEEFVYEVALWPLLLAKTVLSFAFRADKTYGYVTIELDKPPQNRYQEYLSPILYWLLLAVAPSFIVINSFLHQSTGPFAVAISKEPIEVRLATIIVFLIWPPLTFAVSSLLRQRIKLTREALRRPFYV
jgi:hypothetical protein